MNFRVVHRQVYHIVGKECGEVGNSKDLRSWDWVDVCRSVRTSAGGGFWERVVIDQAGRSDRGGRTDGSYLMIMFYIGIPLAHRILPVGHNILWVHFRIPYIVWYLLETLETAEVSVTLAEGA